MLLVLMLDGPFARAGGADAGIVSPVAEATDAKLGSVVLFQKQSRPWLGLMRLTRAV